MADTSFTRTDISVVMSRTFDAGIAAVWQAWTQEDQIARWWGPHGFRTEAKLDLRPAGRFAMVMRGTDGETYPLQGEYLEVEAQSRLVMEIHHDDHPANWHDYLALQFTKAGGDEDTLPSLTVITKVTFQALSDLETQLTVEQVFATQAERDAFDGMGTTDGWRQSFEKLDRVLENSF
jgi:uncharacterized protein YndB with AHSA1/START domain